MMHHLLPLDPAVKRAAQITFLVIGAIFVSLVLLSLLSPVSQMAQSGMRDAAFKRCAIIENSTWTVSSNGYSCSWRPGVP